LTRTLVKRHRVGIPEDAPAKVNPEAKVAQQRQGRLLCDATPKCRLPEAVMMHGTKDPTDGGVITNPMLAARLEYAARRWWTFPAPADGSKKSLKSAERSGGVRWGATIDPEVIRKEFRSHRFRDQNVGIMCGVESGIFVIETDTAEHGDDIDGEAALNAWEADNGALPPTLMARSPSGSVHRYFRHPGRGIKVKSFSAILGEGSGVDCKADGGMVLAPPSVRPATAAKAGGVYSWVNAGHLIADAPEALLDVVIESDRDNCTTISSDDGPPDVDKMRAALAVIPADEEGVWFRVAALLQKELGQDGLALFDEWSKKSTKYNAREVREKWKYSRSNKKIGVGSLYHLANEAQPGWRDEYDEMTEALMRQSNAAATCEDEVNQPRAAEQPQVSPTASTTGLMPVDLWASFPPPELPDGLLPRTVEKYARAEAKTMGADVAGIAMGALTVCAAAISDSIQLQVKKHSPHWTESARLWVAVIGDPSSKKSPILRLVAAPLARIDARLHRKYIADKSVYDNLSPEEKKEAIPPKQRRVRIEDTTIEAAQEVLKDSPDGVLCLQDELSGWFGGMDKYSGKGAAKDRAFWLQSFNGGEYVFNRVSRGSIIIENLSVSMLGGIQPDPMRKLAADSVDDGLLQRVCPIILRASTMGQDEPDDGAWKFYGDLVDRLHEMRTPNSVLRFDNGAQVIRQRLEQKHLDLMNCEAVNKKLSAHIGKYDGLFARLCVLWHCIENASSDRLADLSATVTENTAQRVADFIHTFLLPHALSFYAGVLGLSDDHDRLSAVAGYILARGLGRITNRHIQHGDRTMRKMTKKDTDQIFEQLEAFGWVWRREAKKPGAAPIWEVNPEVHRLFAERAAKEASRRLSVRDAIAEALG
jgi:hypothetical protein